MKHRRPVCFAEKNNPQSGWWRFAEEINSRAECDVNILYITTLEYINASHDNVIILLSRRSYAQVYIGIVYIL